MKVLTLFHILSYGVVRVHQADGKPTQIQRYVQEVLSDNLVLVKGFQDVFVFCAGRGRPPTEPLPDGWIMTFHNSGVPVYLHRESRVVTWSRPYFLGTGSIRVGESSVIYLGLSVFSACLLVKQTQSCPDNPFQCHYRNMILL